VDEDKKKNHLTHDMLSLMAVFQWKWVVVKKVLVTNSIA
jgi:hypothetical protein